MTSFLALKRLRVTRGGAPVYDETFHLGTNIIRGENGSGKSTISDFIFFALGGEFDAWKETARLCDEVQAEIITASGTLTIRRGTSSKLEPALVFFGPIDEAATSGINGWQRFGIRRVAGDTNISFSQLLFRSCQIPEAATVGGANVTAHQILRLMYSDQQTPAGKLFRFETFDTRDIRQAVGDLMIGVNGYRLYDTQLELRQTRAAYSEKERDYNAALAALPSVDGLSTLASLEARFVQIEKDREQALQQIASVDDSVNTDQTNRFLALRDSSRKSLNSASRALQIVEQQIQSVDHQLAETQSFLVYLLDIQSKLSVSSDISEHLGDLEFQYCPACLRPLPDHGDGHCVVCGQAIDEERQRSRFLELKIDNELQVRETRQLLASKSAEREDLGRRAREARAQYREGVQDFATQFENSAPREAFLAERHRVLGRLDRERVYLESLRDAVTRLDSLSADRHALNNRIAELEASQKRLFSSAQSRTQQALGIIDRIGKSILKQDLSRQDEFEDPTTFSVNFADDAILVDGKMNFAESSNVIAKNSAILAIFSAATLDDDFWHPRFVLFDNVEDKGMEEIRSHNFQKIIVERSRAARLPHQVIFTTSMMSPDLEGQGLTVGPKYTRSNKALRFA